ALPQAHQPFRRPGLGHLELHGGRAADKLDLYAEIALVAPWRIFQACQRRGLLQRLAHFPPQVFRALPQIEIARRGTCGQIGDAALPRHTHPGRVRQGRQFDHGSTPTWRQASLTARRVAASPLAALTVKRAKVAKSAWAPRRLSRRTSYQTRPARSQAGPPRAVAAR